MKVIYHPTKRKVTTAMKHDDPLLILVSHGGDRALIANADDSMEHHILLKQAGHPAQDIDQYFRIVANRSGADWTFVCPVSYRNIRRRESRIDQFYRDGIAQISRLLDLIGYPANINIPVRYRRHLKELASNGNGNTWPKGA